MTGWIQINAVGRQMAEACRIVDSTTREAILDPMGLAVSQNRTGKLPSNCVLIRRDGLDIPIEDSISPIRDRIGRVTGAVIVFRDVSGTRALQEELAHAACHDALTGLPNRVLMTDRVSQAILLARRQRSQSAILFIDLDGFKHINDSLGHVIGDKLLQSVSGRLLACVRAPDTVCRQGGDEFVVLLQELRHASDAAITAKRMLRAIAAVYLIDNREIFVTGSIGVSVYPGDGTDAETLIKNADAAMYQAKRNGHHDYRFFDPDIDDHAAERYSTEQSLRGALERKEFTLHYQPKFDLKSGAISGAEALLRWTHPVLGSVLPSRFIPIAEESGLIVPIGAWVLHEACLQARAWAEAGLTVAPIAVNVSAVQFRSESFLQNLFADLSETGLDPQSLALEMTESVLMRSPELTAPILRALKEKGISVSVDDFGTGYSSLSYLRNFPLDALKIDRSFVQHLGDASHDRAIVRSIISLGQSLHLRVVAEGIETLQDLNFLKDQGCDEGQGYYFFRPLPALQFAGLLVRSTN